MGENLTLPGLFEGLEPAKPKPSKPAKAKKPKAAKPARARARKPKSEPEPEATEQRTWKSRPKGQILTPWEKQKKILVAHKWPGGMNQGTYEIHPEWAFGKDGYRVYWIPKGSKPPHNYLNELGNAVHRHFDDYSGVPAGLAPDHWATVDEAKAVAIRHAQSDLPVGEAPIVPKKPDLSGYKAPHWYTQSETEYWNATKSPFDQRPEAYADWVKRSFDWKIWGGASPAFYAKPDDPWYDPGWRYGVMGRAPDDPERMSREQARELGLGYGALWANLKKEPVPKLREAILKATADGRPRTWNRITVETFGITADVVPRNVERALAELVGENLLAFTVRESGGILFWNDARWRELHGRPVEAKTSKQPSKPKKKPAKKKPAKKPRKKREAPSVMDQIMGEGTPLPQGRLRPIGRGVPEAKGKKLTESQTEALRLDTWLEEHYPNLVDRVAYLVEKHDALVVINTSGGKDSQAMFLYLTRELKLPRRNVLVVHADLPGADWPGTTEWVLETTRPHEVHVVRADMTFDEKIRQRQKFPDAARRFCTSDLKRGPIQKLVRGILCQRAGKDVGCTSLPKTAQRIVVNAMGMRAQESPGRSKLEPWSVDLKATAANRLVFNWLPIHRWTTDEVFAFIRKHGQRPFWIYGRTPADRKKLLESGAVNEDGTPRPMSRMSCQFCILSSAGDQLTAAMLAPERAQQICGLERLTGHTMKAKVRKRKGKAPEVIQEPMEGMVEKAREIQRKGLRSAKLRVLP